MLPLSGASVEMNHCLHRHYLRMQRVRRGRYVAPPAGAVLPDCGVCGNEWEWVVALGEEYLAKRLDSLRVLPINQDWDINNPVHPSVPIRNSPLFAMARPALPPSPSAVTATPSASGSALPSVSHADALALRIAQLSAPTSSSASSSNSRTLMSEFMGVNKKIGKNIYPKGCLGPSECKNVICDHKFLAPAGAGGLLSLPPNVVPLRSVDERVLSMVVDKMDKDGYKVSRAYAMCQLTVVGAKIVPAIKAMKDDIDMRKRKIDETGRVSIAWESTAETFDTETIDKNPDDSEIFSKTTGRRKMPIQLDAFLAFLEDEDVMVKDVYKNGMKSRYITNLSDPTKRENTYTLYWKEGEYREAREKFFRLLTAKGEGLETDFEDTKKKMDAWDVEHKQERSYHIFSPFRIETLPLPKDYDVGFNEEEIYGVEEEIECPYPKELKHGPAVSVAAATKPGPFVEMPLAAEILSVEKGKGKAKEVLEPLTSSIPPALDELSSIMKGKGKEREVFESVTPIPTPIVAEASSSAKGKGKEREASTPATSLQASVATKLPINDSKKESAASILRKPRMYRGFQDDDLSFLVNYAKSKKNVIKPKIFVQGPDGEDAIRIAATEPSVSTSRSEASTETEAATAEAHKAAWLKHIFEANIPRPGERAHSYVENGTLFLRAPSEIEAKRKGIIVPSQYRTFYSADIPKDGELFRALQGLPRAARMVPMGSSGSNGAGSRAHGGFSQGSRVPHMVPGGIMGGSFNGQQFGGQLVGGQQFGSSPGGTMGGNNNGQQFGGQQFGGSQAPDGTTVGNFNGHQFGVHQAPGWPMVGGAISGNSYGQQFGGYQVSGGTMGSSSGQKIGVNQTPGQYSYYQAPPLISGPSHMGSSQNMSGNSRVQFGSYQAPAGDNGGSFPRPVFGSYDTPTPFPMYEAPIGGNAGSSRSKADILIENVLKYSTNPTGRIAKPGVYQRSVYNRIPDMWLDNVVPFDHTPSTNPAVTDAVGVWSVEMISLYNRLTHLNDDISGFIIDSGTPPAEDINHIMSEGPVISENVAKLLWNICTGSAALAVAFWVAAKPLIHHHIERRGDPEIRDTMCEVEMMRIGAQMIEEASDKMEAQAEHSTEKQGDQQAGGLYPKQEADNEAEEKFYANNPKAAEKAKKKAEKKVAKKATKK